MKGKRQRLSIKDKLKDFKLCYNVDELTEALNTMTETESGIFSNNKRIWLHDKPKPKLIQQIIEQVNKYFKLEESEIRVCLYYPGDVEVKQQSYNVMNRVIISSVDENPTISFGSAEDKVNITNWTAYLLPPMSSSMLSLEFSNDKVMTMEAKKGHRSQKKVRHIERRYIFLIDYIVSDDKLNVLTQELIEKMRNLNPNTTITRS